MLGGDSFVKAGWVHGLKAHFFNSRCLIIGKQGCVKPFRN